MKGDAEVIDLLNAVLTHELTAINQYFIHAKMCEDWGYHRLAKRKRSVSIEKMWHADWMIGRILLLEGTPNLQRLNHVMVGEDVPEQHDLDRKLDVQARDRLNAGIETARQKGDNGSRELLEKLLHNTEESLDYLEAQLHIIGEVGKERYLITQLGEAPE